MAEFVHFDLKNNDNKQPNSIIGNTRLTKEHISAASKWMKPILEDPVKKKDK